MDGLVRALDRGLGYVVLNFGAGRQVSVLQVVQGLEKHLGRSADIEWLPPQTGDVKRTWADIGAAREVLGYAPEVDFEAGLRRFVEWLVAGEGQA